MLSDLRQERQIPDCFDLFLSQRMVHKRSNAITSVHMQTEFDIQTRTNCCICKLRRRASSTYKY